jgi:rubredoxin-NAD+ reductase
MTAAPVVIVGAGMAGYALARELRRQDASAGIVLVTADAGDVYAKPMLSNAIAAGKEANQLVTASAAQMAASLGMRIMTHAPVRHIDRAARAIETDGERLRYGSLVLALGAEPVRLPLDGDAAAEVLSVNHIADYLVLRRRLAGAGPRARVAILGAGLIGCELADDLLAGGHEVALVDPNPRPLAALAAPSLSASLAEAWRSSPLSLHMRTRALAAHRAGRGYVLELSGGGRIQADVVISAVGVRPAATLALRAGLKTARGIVIDAYGRTSAPHVHALGDCAEYEVEGGRAVLPFVAPMLSAARALGATLSGAPARIALKPEPVVVKTRSRRLALLPPRPGLDGAWHSEMVDGRTVARFIDYDGMVRGFGLTEPTAALRASLLSELGQPRPSLSARES